MPKNWKYIKKQLEKEFLCEKLRGQITYDLTDYRPAPWYQQHFIMKCNDEVLLDVSQPQYQWDRRSESFNVESSFCSMIAGNLYQQHNLSEYALPRDKFDHIVTSAIGDAFTHVSHFSGVYGVKEVIDAIGVFLHSGIQESLQSEEYFIRALAVLDRRCGRRTLEQYALQRYVGLPDWLKRIYCLRFETERIPYSSAYVTASKK